MVLTHLPPQKKPLPIPDSSDKDQNPVPRPKKTTSAPPKKTPPIPDSSDKEENPAPCPQKKNRKKKPKKKFNVLEFLDDAMVIDSDDQVKAWKTKKKPEANLKGMVDTDIEEVSGKEETPEEELGQF